MVVLFACPHAGSCRGMERELISYARETNFIVKPKNVFRGGDNIHDGAETYYVYIVID